jgi:phenylalanyl-tRNA synthetase beta chain
MICSVRELGIGDDHTGILVLGSNHGSGGYEIGTDLLGAVPMHEDVLDIAITPDRGYAMSVRGLARELATAYGVAFHDPAERAGATLTDVAPAAGDGYPVELDTDGCDRFVAVTVTGLDPAATSPLWLRSRLYRSGIRPISLAVDVTNYVQLELGQPLHAYDGDTLSGPIRVRDARAGERATTLDGTERTLCDHDVVITDSGSGEPGSRIIGVAGVMGGADTEIRNATTTIVLEAAHFDPVAISRTGRRLGLASEAARRFERGVDPLVPPVAAARAAQLLVELGGARVTGVTDVGTPALPTALTMRADHPDRVAGMTYGADVVTARLRDIGCAVEAAADDGLTVTPPSWRPDLLEPNDLAEEVIRLEGYERLPSVLPRTLAGKGLTARQRMRRRIGRALAAAGYVEVLPSPFVGDAVLDALRIAADDPRRGVVRLANPLSDEEPYLRPLLLPDLLTTLRRNVGRGFGDVALYEAGRVFRATRDGVDIPRPGIEHRPSDSDLAAIDAALPAQPEHVAVVLAGDSRPSGWWGAGEPATWADAVAAARTVAAAAGVELTVRAPDTEITPWHPGRCAELVAGDVVVGHAGELHPRTIGALDLSARTCAL